MDNEAVLRDQFAAAENRADWPRAMDAYDEGVVLLAGEELPSPGFHFGMRAVGKWFADWLISFEERVAFDIVAIEKGRNRDTAWRAAGVAE